ncbi:hypothetical protein D3C76_1825990 [compost metagenome]
MTVPVAEAPDDKYRVVWTSAADDLWQRLNADQPLSGAVPTAPADAGASVSAAGA